MEALYIYIFFTTLGAMFGFARFVMNLESEEMRNVIFRPDEYGIKRFNPSGVGNYLINPFKSLILWNPELLYVNWIFMTIVHALVGLFLAFMIHKSLLILNT